MGGIWCDHERGPEWTVRTDDESSLSEEQQEEQPVQLQFTALCSSSWGELLPMQKQRDETLTEYLQASEPKRKKVKKSAPLKPSPPMAPPKVSPTPSPAPSPAKLAVPLAHPSAKKSKPVTSRVSVEKLATLRHYIVSLGGEASLLEGWTARTERRTGGSSSGTSDTYYYNPEGVKFRSRQEVLRKFGL